MRWIYSIEWMDGQTTEYTSSRFVRASPDARNLVVYVNPHGHDYQYDEIVIPLVNVRSYGITEVSR
jgi:hypothetical protein